PAPWAGHVELRSARARPPAASRNNEQRDTERRPSRGDEDALHFSGTRGSLADSLLRLERAGVHGARRLPCELVRRSGADDADWTGAAARAWTQHAAASGARRARALD